MLTEAQIIDGTKTVTRRLKWLWAKPGMRLMACRKCMGRKAGEPLVRLREIEILSVRREPLDVITQDECRLEGFPDMTPEQFVSMFASHMNCHTMAPVTRVEFKYVNEEGFKP